MSALSDAVITYAIQRKFTTPIQETTAYKLGLVDAQGYPTEKANSLAATETVRDSYTLLDRLVFKLKRMWSHMPAFAKLIGGYAAALAFIKEDVDNHDDFSVFEHLDPSNAEYFGEVLKGNIVLPIEEHVIIKVAENPTLLRELVEAYEAGTQDTLNEDGAVASVSSAAMSGNAVSTGQVQGLATEPVISKDAQKKWTLKNRGRKIEEILP